MNACFFDEGNGEKKYFHAKPICCYITNQHYGEQSGNKLNFMLSSIYRRAAGATYRNQEFTA